MYERIRRSSRFFLLVLITTFSTRLLYAQLVTNGSFENAVPGPVAENDVPGWVLNVGDGVDPAPVFEIVEDVVQHGNQALKVDVIAVGANPWSIQVVAENIPVTPGTTYLYSIWAKSGGPGAQVNFTVGNYSYNEYGVLRPANLSHEEWREFTFEFTITDQQTLARAPIHLSLDANTGNTIYLDNLRIIDRQLEIASRVPILFEAESGEIGSDFAVLEDDDITFVQIQTDGGDYTPAVWNFPGFDSRIVTYEVTFPMADTYNLFARIRVGPQRFDDDSFFYARGFGVKDPVNPDDWIIANQLQVAGFSNPDHIVHEPGGLGEGVWKWVNLSQNSYHAPATTFEVEEGELTVVFQIGGREDGFDIDRFAFGRADLYYTVGNLENGEPGSGHLPGEIWEGPPLADGHPKFLGSAYSTPQAQNFASYWNQVTPENAGKWGSVEGTRNAMNWGGLDAAYHLAKDNGFPFRFHVLIWGNQQPGWIEALAHSPAEQLAEIREWFEAVAERYPDIDYLEVVNEPLHDPPAGPTNGDYIEALGGTGETGWDWVLNAFRMAREIFPSTTRLMINEYGIIGSTNNVNRYLEIIRLLQAEDLIDCIGIQGHAFSTRGSAVLMNANLNTLAGTGLPIQITELDIDGPTDPIQLTDYRRIFPVIWEHPAVIGVTLWGWRPGLWRNTEGAYLVEQNGDERPALVWLREYVASTKTAADRIAESPRTMHLEPNYPNPFNPSTVIGYRLSEKTKVTLDVMDVQGRHIRTLVQDVQAAGRYAVTFDAGDLPSGLYFYRLATHQSIQVGRMLLMK
ncbi:MAG TPA: T9SS type A sorting domain-containing protein [bacterium]|nr:T9SS type A sorting domain-containing protein [bacterium]